MINAEWPALQLISKPLAIAVIDPTLRPSLCTRFAYLVRVHNLRAQACSTRIRVRLLFLYQPNSHYGQRATLRSRIGTTDVFFEYSPAKSLKKQA